MLDDGLQGSRELDSRFQTPTRPDLAAYDKLIVDHLGKDESADCVACAAVRYVTYNDKIFPLLTFGLQPGVGST